MRNAGLTQEIVDLVSLRTPAFTSWQQEEWLSHCGDVCEYLGDATAADLTSASAESKAAWKEHYELEDDDWKELTQAYAPGGDPAFYKFRCIHCRKTLFGWDCS